MEQSSNNRFYTVRENQVGEGIVNAAYKGEMGIHGGAAADSDDRALQMSDFVMRRQK